MESGRDESVSRDEDERTTCDEKSRVEMDDEEMNEESSSGQAENNENGLILEEMENPSWVFIAHLNSEMRYLFNCLCNECQWKGEEDADLAMHLKAHVELEYELRRNKAGEENDEGGMDDTNMSDMNSTEHIFVACPISFCNRAFPVNRISCMHSHMSMHANHASLQKKGLITLKSKEEFANIRSCGKKQKLLSAHSGDAHICMWDECYQSFIDVNEFFSHVLSHMDYLQDTHCLWDSCSHSFRHKSRLIPHVHQHMGMKTAGCPFCGEVFSSFPKLFDHISRRLEDDNGTKGEILCKLCRKTFPNEMSLRLHAKRHIVKFGCDECGVLFPSKHDLNRHCESVHSTAYPQLVCSFPNCTKIFSSNLKLLQHLKCHSENSVTCPECSSEFRWPKQLTKHINMEHNKEGLPQYVCHLCNRHYEEGSSLSRHLKKKHEVAIPPGFPRFQYKKCEDGLYRLQTNRPFL